MGLRPIPQSAFLMRSAASWTPPSMLRPERRQPRRALITKGRPKPADLKIDKNPDIEKTVIRFCLDRSLPYELSEQIIIEPLKPFDLRSHFHRG